jgi:hypothetical protein
MKVPIVALALLLQARPTVAPATVSGVVLQNGSNEPLPGVRVSLARTDAALGAFGRWLPETIRPPM